MGCQPKQTSHASQERHLSEFCARVVSVLRVQSLMRDVSLHVGFVVRSRPMGAVGTVCKSGQYPDETNSAFLVQPSLVFPRIRRASSTTPPGRLSYMPPSFSSSSRHVFAPPCQFRSLYVCPTSSPGAVGSLFLRILAAWSVPLWSVLRCGRAT